MSMHALRERYMRPQEDKLLERIIPILGLGVSILSAALATMALMRLSPITRVYYGDEQYLVSVRYRGQWQNLSDFIQPDNPDVLAIYWQIGPDAWSLYNFVCQNVRYVADFGEWWRFPSETLRGYGDCEDSANLLTSLLRCFCNAHTVLGSYYGYGHAWCELHGFIYETTYTEARVVQDPEAYERMAMFNDREVIELWPGALNQVFELNRDEATKLNLMAKTLDLTMNEIRDNV